MTACAARLPELPHKVAREWLARTGFGKYEVDPPPMSLLRIGQSYARQCYFLQCAKSNLLLASGL